MAADPRTTWKNQTTRCEKARAGNKGAGGQGGARGYPDGYAMSLYGRNINISYYKHENIKRVYIARNIAELTLSSFIESGAHVEKEMLQNMDILSYLSLYYDSLFYFKTDSSLTEKWVL